MEDRVRIALIPSYEPDENLQKIVQKLSENNFKIVVVNDGSGENYQKYFKNLDAEVISYNKNIGKGHALKTGLKYISAHYNNYIVVTMDSDGQHTPEDAIKLCKYIENNPNELVLGSRKRGKNTPLRSYLGNSITRFVYRAVTNEDIYDTQTGLRAFTEKLTSYMLDVDGERFEYEMNVLLYATQNNIKIKELTIKTIYIDNNSKSHFNTLKDSFKIYKQILKFSASSFISFLIDYIFYTLFTILSGNIVLANIMARIISSLTNYNINKRLVFNSKNKSFIKYYLLVITILTLNTIILWLISHIINVYVAKIITEIILFTLSYIIQKKLIFKGSDKH